MSATLIERLRQDRGRLATAVVGEMYEDPFWSERFEARGRFHSEQDLAFHIDYLAQALAAKDPTVMERYARWLQNVLTTRGMCTLHLADSFGRLARIIDDPAATSLFRAAREALLYEGGSARALQERIHDVITTGSPGRIEDTPYHYAYLADAIALGQPKVFIEHVTWLAGYLGRHGRDARTLRSTLEALTRTLEIEQARDLVATALRVLP